MDNLRLSMDREMSLSMVLRYRSNAVALSRAGEQCRKILEVVQGNRKPAQKSVPIETTKVPAPKVLVPDVLAPKIPAPDIAAAPPAPVQPKATTVLDRSLAAALGGAAMPANFLSEFPLDIASMKRDARLLLAAFSKDAGATPAIAAIFSKVPDPAQFIDAAIRHALAPPRVQASEARV